MKLTAKELSGMHVGKTITVILDGLHLQTERQTGILYAVSHGSRLVNVTLGIARIEGIPHNTPITIQKDKRENELEAVISDILGDHPEHNTYQEHYAVLAKIMQAIQVDRDHLTIQEGE